MEKRMKRLSMEGVVISFSPNEVNPNASIDVEGEKEDEKY